MKISPLFWLAGGAAAVALFQPRSKAPTPTPTPTPKTLDPKTAVGLVVQALADAIQSSAWSEASKETLQAVHDVLEAKPNTLFEIFGAPLKPTAAYDSLAALPEAERQNYLVALFGKTTGGLGDRLAQVGWVYFHLGGKDKGKISQAQSYISVPQTGILDEATLTEIQKRTQKPFWTPVLEAWKLTPKVGGTLPKVPQSERVAFLRAHWPEMVAYAPMQLGRDSEEALKVALQAYRSQIEAEGYAIDPRAAAQRAYEITFLYGRPQLARHTKEIKEFFQGVLARLDDMILYETMRQRGLSERQIQKAFPEKGLPPGAEPGGFLQ